MPNNLTASQLKEQAPEAYNVLEETYKKLHDDDHEDFMKIYGYVDVKYVLSHYIKYDIHEGIIYATHYTGLISKWDSTTNEWDITGSIYLN